MSRFRVTLECGDEFIVRAEDDDDLPVWATCPKHPERGNQSIVDFEEVE